MICSNKHNHQNSRSRTHRLTLGLRGLGSPFLRSLTITRESRPGCPRSAAQQPGLQADRGGSPVGIGPIAQPEAPV